jgi:hypothetical protein
LVFTTASLYVRDPSISSNYTQGRIGSNAQAMLSVEAVVI